MAPRRGALRHTAGPGRFKASLLLPEQSMSRAFNFSPGPATLPETVLCHARDHLLEFPGAGAAILQLTHRSPAVMTGPAEAEAHQRTLLSVPPGTTLRFLSRYT